MRRHRLLPILAALGSCWPPAAPTRPHPAVGAEAPTGPMEVAGRRPAARCGSASPAIPTASIPGLAVLAESYTIYELVYDTPITVTAEGEFVPKLATELDRSPRTA